MSGHFKGQGRNSRVVSVSALGMCQALPNATSKVVGVYSPPVHMAGFEQAKLVVVPQHPRGYLAEFGEFTDLKHSFWIAIVILHFDTGLRLRGWGIE